MTDIARSDRASRIMAAALSRRRALRGLAGMAALGLAGRARRGSATGDLTQGHPFLHLSGAAIYPPDLPDGDSFGLFDAITYVGIDGGRASGKLTDPLIAAFGPFAEMLIGGQSTVLTPLDGSQNAWAQTELWQFPTNQEASAVRDVFSTPGPGVTTLPGGSDKGTFLAALSQADGSTVDARYVVFRFQSIVGRLTTGWRYGADQTGPDPEVSGALLEELRKASVRRLQHMTDGGANGIATTVPTLAEVASVSNGRAAIPINYWRDFLTFIDGRPIRLIFDTEEEFQRFIQSHDGVQDSFTRIENTSTFGGNPLLVQVTAQRHDTADGAVAYANNAAAKTAEAAAADPNFDSRPIDPPPGVGRDQRSQWFEERFGPDSAQQLGVRGLHRTGTDVVGILVAGAPRPPAQNDGPESLVALQNFGATALSFYDAWIDGDVELDEEFEGLIQYCQAWDELIRALDAQ